MRKQQSRADQVNSVLEAIAEVRERQRAAMQEPPVLQALNLFRKEPFQANSVLEAIAEMRERQRAAMQEPPVLQALNLFRKKPFLGSW